MTVTEKISYIETTSGQPERGEYRFFGPPGTGKTTAAARTVARAAEKFGSDAVIVASFTRAAAEELASRDLPLDPAQTGTLHSHCFRALGRPLIAEGNITKAAKNSPVVPWNEWIADRPDWRLSSDRNDEDVANVIRATAGDKLMQAIQIHRGRMMPEEAWTQEQRDFYAAWRAWQAEYNLTDFTGLIERAIEETEVAPGAPAVGVFDEVQDFTPLQLKLVRRWINHMQFAIMAGDDDQTLYSWIGCSPDAFLNPPVPDEQKRLLSRSYRVPRAVHALATAWISQVKVREPKDYQPRDADGAVYTSGAQWTKPEALLPGIEAHLEAGETVMLLASCSYMLRPTIKVLRDRGIPFHNPYRTNNGAWNPLGARKGTTASDRLLAFLRPEESVWGAEARFWTLDDLRAWVMPLRAKDVLVRGAKKRLEELPDDTPVTWDLLAELFHERHLDPIFEGDTGWYERNLPKDNTFGFPLAVLRKYGADGLRKPPQVVVGTIHSVKGGQAQHVYLWPDLSPDGFAKGYLVDPDPVIRQFYVGMTRASETLTLCRGTGTACIRWPN